MREAPSRVIIEALWARGATVHAFDPVAVPEARRIYGARDDLVLFDESPLDALAGADALVVVTEWHAFRGIDPADIAAALAGDVVMDGRNIFSPEAVRAAGLTYYGIGRP